MIRDRAEILADFVRYNNAEPGEFADVARECECDEVDYVINQVENIVAEAVRAGLIVEDTENNGWHEGWTRMNKALANLAQAAGF